MNANNEEEESELDSKAVSTIIQILTDKNYSESTRLNILQGIKLIFSKGVRTIENEIINSFSIESLFDIIRSIDKQRLIENHVDYINYLIHLLQLNTKNLNEKLLLELADFLRELDKNGINISNDIIHNIWKTLRNHSWINSDLIQQLIPQSKQFLEVTVAGWIVSSNCDDIKYYAEVSIHSPCAFQMVCCILNTFVTETQGSDSVLKLVERFVSLVNDYCIKGKKSILCLYPRQYVRLISLLMVMPKVYPNNKKTENVPVKIEICEMIYNFFMEDKDMILMLLVHYPKWLSVFSNYLKCIQKDN